MNATSVLLGLLALPAVPTAEVDHAKIDRTIAKEPTSQSKAPQYRDDPSQMKVRLKLNAIEAANSLEHYDALVKRELGLQDSVRACRNSGDERLPQYLQALQETTADLETTKKRLIALESERTKLTERLEPKAVVEESLEQMDRVNRTLEKILERLASVDRRLEKLERRR